MPPSSQDPTPRESDNSRCYGGVWVPAIPGRAPYDVRWCCTHEWTPLAVIGSDGTFLGYSHIDYGCLRCGAVTDAAGAPPAVWPMRRWIAERLTSYGRKVRHAR